MKKEMPRSFRRSLLWGFGSLVLTAMFLFAFATLFLNANIQRMEGERLSGSLAATIGEAIGRVSFSGKYQTRLLVEELQKKVPVLAYISVDSPQGTVLAHSEPVQIDAPLNSDTREFDRRSLETDRAVFREYKNPGGILYSEVAVPYRGGFDNTIQGVVRIGIDLAEVQHQELIIRLLLGTFGILLTILTLLAVLRLSAHFGKQMRSIAEQLEAILENSPVGMAIFTPQGQVLRYNRRFTELFGYTLEEVPTVAQWFALAYPDLDYRNTVETDWNREVEKYLRGGGVFTPFETRVLCRDKTEKDIEFRFESIGQIYVTTFTDLTERKKAEEERLTLERQMLHVQKLESLGVMASGMAHDFNNLLMAIMGHVELARFKLYQGEPVADSLDEISLAARRASDLSRQMLAYSGRGKQQIELIDLPSLIREISQLLKASVSKQADFHLELNSQLPRIKGDPTQVRQIVMNLIMNASEALGEKAGQIGLTTGRGHYSRADLDAMILGTEIPEGDYLYLQVRDSGCGMDPETLHRIFEPFFTTKFTGRGLGMSAVLGIVRSHRGAIRIDSEAGKGSQFTVLFPPENSEMAGPSGQPNSPVVWRASGTALVVDDDPKVLEVSSRLLEALGFRVLTASRGEEALRIFQEEKNAIRFALLDLIMPGMDGSQVAQELRRQAPELKMVLYSGITQEDVHARYPHHGADGFLQKPFDLDQLRRLLHQLMG